MPPFTSAGKYQAVPGFNITVPILAQNRAVLAAKQELFLFQNMAHTPSGNET